MPSKEKKEKVKQIRKWFEGTDSLLVVRYKGLRVAEANALRRRIKDLGAELRVLKNTLTRLALADSDKEALTELVDGPIAVVFARDDLTPVAGVIREFSKGREEFYLMGGLLEGRLIDVEQARMLASLPPRDVVMAQMIGKVSSPLTAAVNVCVAPLRKLVGLLNALVEKKKAEGAREREPAAEGTEEADEEAEAAPRELRSEKEEAPQASEPEGPPDEGETDSGGEGDGDEGERDPGTGAAEEGESSAEGSTREETVDES